MKNKINQYKLYFIGFIAGGIARYLYWFYIGCNNETCAITSSPVKSSFVGCCYGNSSFKYVYERKNHESENIN